MNIAPPPNNEFLSTSQAWFDIWLTAFGAEHSGIWRPSQSGNNVAIPYQLAERHIGPVMIKIAKGASNSHTPRYDVVGELHDPRMLAQMMSNLHVDMLEFPYVSLNSRLIQALHRQPAGVMHQLSPCESAPCVNCGTSWDDYWQSRGKSRTEWNRRERRLMEDRHARFVCFTEWRDVEPLFTDILKIEASGWKGRQGSAINQHQDTLSFYTQSVRDWAERGMLRVFILFLEEVPVAFELDAEINGVLNCVKHGYLEDYAKLGPGQVLRTQVLRWAFANPKVKVFDMFGPATESKLKWATGAENLYTLRVFRRSARGLLAWLRWVTAPYLKSRLTKIRGARQPQLD